MICSLRGTVMSKLANSAIIEVAGVGYAVGMSTASLATLPAVGDEAFVWTYMAVREDGIALYGFCSQEERVLFEKLIGVSGIGPKVALSALSTFAVDTFTSIITAGDATRVATVPGIGKKTAQRIVLELKGSVEELLGGNLFENAADEGGTSAATQALLAMGFTSAEVELALKGYDGSDDAEALRWGLKKLGSNS